MQNVGPHEDLSSATAHTVGLRTYIGPEDLVRALTRAKDEAEEALVECSQQLASTEEEMTIWKKRAEDQHGHCRRLQVQMDECHRQLQATLVRNERLSAENHELRHIYVVS
ncbi:TPA: hypothetical protein ACH3X2_003524 [Trebouxia sp. C0005]